MNDSRAVQALLVVLSITAGCTDIIGFLGLNGLFTAHITGNVVILAAQIVGGGDAQLAQVLSVPVFIVVVVLTVLLAHRLQSSGHAAVRPLLLLQFLLLAGFLVLCVAQGPRIDPDAVAGIVAGMLGVAAMAVQNALVQISFNGAPPTAVMTGNVTRFAVDVAEVLLRGDSPNVANARKRAGRILPVILGFAAGGLVGAVCMTMLDLWSLVLPAALALLAFAMGCSKEFQPSYRPRAT